MPDIPKFNPTALVGRTSAPIDVMRGRGALNTPLVIPQVPAIPVGNLNPAMSFTGFKPDFLRGSNDVLAKTPFSHDKKDNNPAATATDITVDLQSNVLDNYDAYTYHFKLFITSTEAAATGEILTPTAQTIIVENGVTDVSIDKVEFQGIAVPSLQAGTGTQTLMKFEILEPGGAGLLDKIYYEAVALGIGNWFVMPCYLQLEFRGRDPINSEPVTGGDPGALAGLSWIWPIKITNMKATVTTGGTRYDVDAIFYDELAQSNAYFVLQHNTVLTGLEKFGDAMTQLQDKLNLDTYIQTIDNYSIPDTYQIIVDPDLENIELLDPSANKTTSRAGDYLDFIKKTATYNTGTGIDKIIDSLLGSTKYYQQNLQSSSTSTSSPDTSNAAKPMRELWRIITETKPTKFDHLRQDNAVAITVYIVKYDIGLLEANASQTGQTAETLEAARKRLFTYNDSGILRKKYNYIFTGLNDQVLNFDLNMNFSFAAVLSRFGGIYHDTANSDTGVVHHGNLDDERTAIEYTQRAIRWINNPENKADPKEELAAAQSSLATLNISDTLRSRINDRLSLENSKPANRLEQVKKTIAAGGIEGGGELNGIPITPRSLATPPITNPTTKFVSDIDIHSTQAEEARKLIDSTRKGKLRPIPFREGNQENNFVGIDPNSDAGRARTSSMFSTALYSSLDASLMHIKMTIKGDPFWLYPRNDPTGERFAYKSNIEDQTMAIELIKKGHTEKYNKDTVNPYGTDNFIVIRFRTPRIANDDTGITDPYSEVEIYSGIYKVINIASRFEMGKFTQELTCILDNLINLRDFPEFLKQLEATNKSVEEVTTGRPNFLRGSNDIIPDTSIITDKIKAGVSDIKGKVDTARDLAGNVVTKVTSIGTNLTSNIPSDVGRSASDILKRFPI